eukprot:9957543-Lingulodinium_polyedra.AAC.1
MAPCGSLHRCSRCLCTGGARGLRKLLASSCVGFATELPTVEGSERIQPGLGPILVRPGSAIHASHA